MNTQQLSYQLFLAEQASEQAHLEMFIDECILMSEGTNTISNIDIIHESFMDKVKESIKKFLQAIANMWHKFLESMNTLLKTDKAYLEKYKDIILKKNPIEAEYNMYDYEGKKGNPQDGLKLLLKTQVPLINMNSMDKELESDEAFLKAHFGYFIQGAKEPYKIGELAKAKFRGNNGQEITVKSTQLNMTDMYNYCYTYKKLEELIEKDIENIQKTATEIVIKVDKMTREGQIKTESVNIFENSQYLSTVYESFIHEATPGQRTATGTENDQNNNQGNNNQQQPNTSTNQQAAPAQNNPSQAYQKTDKGDSNQEIDNSKTAKELSDKANRYLKLCGEFLGAKQSISEEIYKAYMSIIKAHVRDFIGKKDDNKDNKAKDVASDYNNDKKPEENNNNQEPNKQQETKSSVGGFIKDILSKKKKEEPKQQ